MRHLLWSAAMLFALSGLANAVDAVPLDQLNRIMIPNVVFDEITIPLAAYSLSKQARAQDPDGMGVNLIVAGKPNGTTVTMYLENMPLGEIIRLLCHSTGWTYRLDRHAVVMFPPDNPEERRIPRAYPVEPAIFASGAQGMAPEQALAEFFHPLVAVDDLHYFPTVKRLIALATPAVHADLANGFRELYTQPRIELLVECQDRLAPNPTTAAHAPEAQQGDDQAPVRERLFLIVNPGKPVTAQCNGLTFLITARPVADHIALTVDLLEPFRQQLQVELPSGTSYELMHARTVVRVTPKLSLLTYGGAGSR